MCRHQDEFKALGVQGLIVSFGPAPLARRWIEETGAPFPVLIDEPRRVYGAYGLRRSLFRSWTPRTVLTYARLILSGRRWRGIQGDSAQLGGDFVIDGGGIVRFAHRSLDPTDRPAVESLLQHSRV